MVRILKNKRAEYLVINNRFRVRNGISDIEAPMYVQIDLTGLTEEERTKIYTFACKVFNREITVDTEKQKGKKKSWWQKLFKL